MLVVTEVGIFEMIELDGIQLRIVERNGGHASVRGFELGWVGKGSITNKEKCNADWKSSRL